MSLKELINFINMDGIYDWFLDYIGYGENWDGALPLSFSEEAFTALLALYIFVIYRVIKFKGNFIKALFGAKPILTTDKLSVIPKNDLFVIGMVRWVALFVIIVYNYIGLNAIFIEQTSAMEWEFLLFNVVIWMLGIGGQAMSYK